MKWWLAERMFTPNALPWWACTVALVCFVLTLASLYSRKRRPTAVLAFLTVLSAAVLVWSAAVIRLWLSAGTP